MKKIFAYLFESLRAPQSLERPEVWILTVAAFATRFWHLGVPNWVVFDETHFGLYATKYLHAQYYFDIHPPLGKMMLGFAAWLGGLRPGFDFAGGAFYPDASFVALRVLPALFGVLLVPLVYLLVKELGFSRRTGFVAGFLVLAENALLLQSRLITLDMFLVFFIFLSLYFFVLAKKRAFLSSAWWLWSAAAGLAVGAAFSVKWIGAGAGAIIWAWLLFEQKLVPARNIKQIVSALVLFAAIPMALYSAVSVAHLQLVPNACKQNCGAILEDERVGGKSEAAWQVFNSPPEGGLSQQFLGLHIRMFGAISEGFGSEDKTIWYALPFMQKPVVYTYKTEEEKETILQLVGNPAVWAFGIVGMLGGLFLGARAYAKNAWHLKMPEMYFKGITFLLLGYLLFFGVFAALHPYLLPYHYFTALLFSVMLFAVFFDWFLSKRSVAEQRIFLAAFAATVLAGFVAAAPHTYGAATSF